MWSVNWRSLLAFGSLCLLSLAVLIWLTTWRVWSMIAEQIISGVDSAMWINFYLFVLFLLFDGRRLAIMFLLCWRLRRLGISKGFRVNFLENETQRLVLFRLHRGYVGELIITEIFQRGHIIFTSLWRMVRLSWRTRCFWTRGRGLNLFLL